jgi:hypothetical protein
MGRDSSVGTATCYEVEGPGIESQLRKDFSHASRQVLRPNLPPVQWVLCGFPGGKAAGAWGWQPTPSSAEVKEIVELYLYSPLGFCGLFWCDLNLYFFNIKQLYNFKVLFVLLSRHITSKRCIIRIIITQCHLQEVYYSYYYHAVSSPSGLLFVLLSRSVTSKRCIICIIITQCHLQAVYYSYYYHAVSPPSGVLFVLLSRSVTSKRCIIRIIITPYHLQAVYSHWHTATSNLLTTCSTAALLQLQFQLPVMPFPPYNYFSTSRSTQCALPNMAAFCSSLTYFVGTLLRYFPSDSEMVIDTGGDFVLTFHSRCISVLIHWRRGHLNCLNASSRSF